MGWKCQNNPIRIIPALYFDLSAVHFFPTQTVLLHVEVHMKQPKNIKYGRKYTAIKDSETNNSKSINPLIQAQNIDFEVCIDSRCLPSCNVPNVANNARFQFRCTFF